jgi:tetratricopeptide (TPR) repeat protein
MNFFYRGLPPVLMGATVVMVQPQLAIALSPTQVSDVAREFTVLIDGDGIGSGVIFERKGDTYFVITNQHVVSNDGKYEIQTPDGNRYPVYRSQVLPGLDIAVLQFTSQKNYRLADLGNSDQIREGMTLYVAGWADSLPGITNERSYQFTDGRLRSRLKNADDGYALVYNNEVIPGMSGGPVLDENGRVVGINGRAGVSDKEGARVAILRMGIPVNTVLTARNRPTTGSPVVAAAPQKRTAEALISLGGVRAKRNDYRGAIYDYNQALRINPNNPDAYLRRSFAYFYLGDFQASVADLNKVLELNPKNAVAYAQRSYLRLIQKDLQGALADGEQAVRLAPNFSLSYLARSSVRVILQDYKGAIADIDRFIQQAPAFAHAYAVRGFARAGLNDKQGANTDFDKAIQLDPNSFTTYQFRGVVRQLIWGDKQGASADFQKVTNLCQQEFSTPICQQIQKEIKLAQDPALLSKQVIADADQAIKLNPQDANAYFRRAVGYIIQEDKKKALENLTQATRFNPKYSQAFIMRGHLLLELGQKEEAIVSYESAIQANSEWGDQKPATAYNNIGLIKYEQGDVEGAIRQFQAAINDHSKSTEPQLALAVALYAKGERERGITMAESALRSDNRYADVEFLKKNLWGERLIADTQKLMESPKIREITSRPSRGQ